MTHLEELRQKEKEILDIIWQLRQATSPSKVERTQRMIQVRGQLRAVRTELALYEVNLVEQAMDSAMEGLISEEELKALEALEPDADTEGYIIILEAIIAGTINRGFDPDDAAWAERELAKLSEQK